MPQFEPTTVQSIFDTHVKKLMVDASIFTSELHSITLTRWGEIPSISRTLAKVLESNKLQFQMRVLSQFTWRRTEPSTAARRLARICEVYEPKPWALEFAKEYLQFRHESNLLREVREILLEELAFLRENSSLLMKGRGTIRLLRQGGAAVVEASNRLRDRKIEVLDRIRGPRWMLGIFVSLTSAGVGVATANPLLSAIGGVGGIAVAVIDP